MDKIQIRNKCRLLEFLLSEVIFLELLAVKLRCTVLLAAAGL